jgi:hypothetical protein
MNSHTRAWATLFRELFWGREPGSDGTFVVEQMEAIVPLLASADADSASREPGHGVQTLASHAQHTAYYVSLLNAIARGEEKRPDWEASWGRPQVDESEWNAIREDLEREARTLLAWVQSGAAQPENDLHATYLWAQVAHAAFHLGSIRQILWLIRPRDGTSSDATN